MTDTTIHEDVDDFSANGGGEFDAAEAFVKGWKEDGESPSETAENEGEREEHEDGSTRETESEEGEHQPEETTEQAPEQTEQSATAKREATDDDEVTVRVGDQDQRVSVKDLKRLFGQEAALTRKSQEVAEVRRAVDAEAQKYAAGLEKMSSAAKARWQEYEKIDWVDARLRMDPNSYAQLRQDATNAFSEAQYFEQELAGYTQQQGQRQQQALMQAAREAVTVLKDPERGIPGWNDALYQDIQRFAVEDMGAPREVVQRIVEPWAIKVLHDAMQYRRGLAALKTSATTTPKPTVKAASKAPNVSREAPSNRAGVSGTRQKAEQQLARSGSLDDAAEAFLAAFTG